MRHAPTFRRALIGPLLTVLAGTLLAGTPAAMADEPPPPVEGKYVALGDSFAAGFGIAPEQPGGVAACDRSTKNFPSLVASAVPKATFVDATCSGAKLTDLWNTQGEAPPQLDAITSDTTLVTFGTLGGNDVGLVGLAANCVLGPNDCTGTSDDANHQKVEGTRDDMIEGIEAVKASAPNATTVMVGYGIYLPPGGCQDKFSGLTADEADYMQGLIDHLSDVIGEVAEAEGVLFADQRDIPNGVEHTPCVDFADQWIRGMDTGDGTDGGPLHPSSAGMRATAELIADTIGITLPPEETPGDDALVRAKKAMKTVKFRATCKTRHAHRVKLKVRGGKSSVSKVVFRIGKHKVKADKHAPYVVKTKTRKLRKIRGKAKAKVTVKVKSLTLTKTFKAKRPRCLKR